MSADQLSSLLGDIILIACLTIPFVIIGLVTYFIIRANRFKKNIDIARLEQKADVKNLLRVLKLAGDPQMQPKIRQVFASLARLNRSFQDRDLRW
jgi:hypothetical protein